MVARDLTQKIKLPTITCKGLANRPRLLTIYLIDISIIISAGKTRPHPTALFFLYLRERPES